jgi:hypothetical protein
MKFISPAAAGVVLRFPWVLIPQLDAPPPIYIE